MEIGPPVTVPGVPRRAHRTSVEPTAPESGKATRLPWRLGGAGGEIIGLFRTATALYECLGCSGIEGLGNFRNWWVCRFEIQLRFRADLPRPNQQPAAIRKQRCHATVIQNPCRIIERGVANLALSSSDLRREAQKQSGALTAWVQLLRCNEIRC